MKNNIGPFMVMLPVFIMLVWFTYKMIELFTRKRRTIRAGTRKARKADDLRKKEAKRLKKQEGIGLSIFFILKSAWILAGEPADKEICLGPDNQGNYAIGVDCVNEQKIPVFNIATIFIDLRRPEDKQVFICNERGSMELPVNMAGQWIRSSLVPQVFPPLPPKA